MRLEEELRRQRNQATTSKLFDVIKKSEDSELKTFELKDRKRELKHELEIDADVDTEIADYLKFEKEKFKKKQTVLN